MIELALYRVSDRLKKEDPAANMRVAAALRSAAA